MNPREAFFVRMTALAAMCNFNLSKEILSLYDHHLSPLGYQTLTNALDDVISGRRSRDAFPSIREIRELIQPPADPESEAIEAAGRIIHAISRIGPYRSEDARAFVGELAWLVVQREGGWRQVCEVLTDDNVGTMRAQWRQMALAQFKRAKAGLTGAPQLPAPDGKVLGMDIKKLLPVMPGVE